VKRENRETVGPWWDTSPNHRITTQREKRELRAWTLKRKGYVETDTVSLKVTCKYMHRGNQDRRKQWKTVVHLLYHYNIGKNRVRSKGKKKGTCSWIRKRQRVRVRKALV